MASDLSIFLSSKLDKKKSVTQINKDILQLEKRLKKINLTATINKSSASQLNNQTKELNKQLQTHNNINRTVKTNNKTISNTTKELSNQSKSLSNIANQTSILSNFSTALKRIPVWIAGLTAIYAPLRSFQGGIQGIRDIDQQLVELAKVTDASTVALEDMKNVALDMGTELGVTADKVLETSVAFSRLGYSISDASQLAKESVIFSTVGNFDVSQATTSLISVMKAYKLEAGEVRGAIDSINQVGNEFAISQEDIAEILRRSSSAMNEANNSLEQTIALATGSQEIVQNSRQVGTALRTVSMRIRGVSEDGSDLSGLVPELESQFNSLGLTLKKDEDTFLSTYEIMKQLASVWDDENITDVAKANILESVAGKRQGQIVAALLNNWESVESALETAQNSAGSAEREFSRATESINFKMNQVANNMQKFWSESIGSDTVKEVADNLVSISGSMSEFSKNVDIGRLAMSGLIGIFARFIPTTTSALNITEGYKLQLALAGNQATTTSGKVQALSVALKQSTLAVNALAVAKSVALSAATIGISYLITGLISKLANFNKSQEEAIKEMERLSQSFSKQKDASESIDGLIKTYEELGEKTKLTNEEQKKLLKTKEKLKNLIPESTNFIDSENLSLEEQVKLLRSLNEEELKQAKRQAGEAINKHGEDYDKNKRQIDALEKSIKKWQSSLDELHSKQAQGIELTEKEKSAYKTLIDFIKQAESGVSKYKAENEAVDSAKKLLNETTKDSSKSLEKENGIINTLNKQIPDYSKNLDSLAKTLMNLEEIQDRVSEGYSYSYTEIQELISKYPELENAVYRTADGWSIEKSAIDNLRQSQIEQERTAINTQIEISREALEQSKNRISAIIDEIGSIKNLADAYAEAAKLGKDMGVSMAEMSSVGSVGGTSNYEEYLQTVGVNFADTVGVGSFIGKNLPDGVLSRNEYNELQSSRNELIQYGKELEEYDKLVNKTQKRLDDLSSGRVSGGSPSSGSGSGNKTEKEPYRAELDRFLKINNAIEDINNQMSRLDSQLNLTDNEREKIVLLEKQNALLEKQQQNYHALANAQREERDSLASSLSGEGFNFTGSGDNMMISNLENIKGKSKEVEEAFNRFIEIQTREIPKAQQEWWSLEESIFGNANTIEDYLIQAEEEYQEKMQETLDKRKEIADDVVDTMKDAYRKQKELAINALNEELRAEEKAYRRRIERLDKRLKRHQEIINAQLEAIDRQEEEDSFNKDLADAKEERAETQKEIDTLQMDNSLEARRRLSDLNKQLEEQDQRIEELTHNREITLRKQNLNDQMDSYRKEIEGKKDAEERKLERTQNRIQREIEAEEWKYDELINDEKYFAELRQEIIDGNLENVQDSLQDFLDDFDDYNEKTVKKIDSSWQSLLSTIENIKDAQDDLDDLPEEPKKPSSGASYSSSGSNSGGGIKSDNQLRYLQKLLDNGTKGQKEWAKNQIKTGQYHVGGVVGSGISKTSQLVHKAFNLKPNEEVAKLLRDEVVIKPNGFSNNFIPNMQKAISGLSNGSSGINLNIDSLVSINGNVGKEDIPAIENAGRNSLGRLQKLLVKNGVNRRVATV